MDADVIVIGAGAAGLAAAGALARRSFRVILLEARERVGGRAWPVPFNDDAAVAELGAEFIHGAAKETRALLRETGTAAIETADAAFAPGEDGELVPVANDFVSAARILERARALEKDESVETFLRRFEDDPSSRYSIGMARAFVEGFDAADPALASAQGIADEWASGVDFNSARPQGGYGAMFEQMMRACSFAGVQTVFSTIARRISWQSLSVAVETNDAHGAMRTFRARAAVVTLPAGVLRHRGDSTAVVFDPELPTRKQIALSSIEMGHVVKVTLRFKTAFWERVRGGKYRDASFLRGGRPFPSYWMQIPLRSRLIVAWVGGPGAAALQGESQQEIVAQALAGFGALLGESSLAQREFEAGIVHDWSSDPFARGAYSYLLTGGRGARPLLAAPEGGVLFFAGEATSNDGQGGTVNGALETGNRAAREAAAALRAGEKS